MPALEELQTRPQQIYETKRSFDVLASVTMLRYDLQTFGEVQPETWQRVYEEELSYIAEGINRPLYATFRLQQRDGELAYFSQGNWRPYMGLLTTGLAVAEREAREDPRKTFMVERATQDWFIGRQLNELAVGEKLAWKSSFPQGETALYGDTFISNFGFQPHRRMGFLYLAEKMIDGSVDLHTMSVDNSDEQAFTNAIATVKKPDTTAETMLRAYDATMDETYGGLHRAGRRLMDTITEENAWTYIQKHQDLLHYFFNELLSIAQRFSASPRDLERSIKRLTYGVWATLKVRLDKASLPGVQSQTLDAISNRATELLQREIQSAYWKFVKKGEIMPGCGGTIQEREEQMLNADVSTIFENIFGYFRPKRNYRFDRYMYCGECQKSPSKDDEKKWCGPCGFCEPCDTKMLDAEDARRRANRSLN